MCKDSKCFCLAPPFAVVTAAIDPKILCVSFSFKYFVPTSRAHGTRGAIAARPAALSEPFANKQTDRGKGDGPDGGRKEEKACGPTEKGKKGRWGRLNRTRKDWPAASFHMGVCCFFSFFFTWPVGVLWTKGPLGSFFLFALAKASWVLLCFFFLFVTLRRGGPKDNARDTRNGSGERSKKSKGPHRGLGHAFFWVFLLLSKKRHG